MKKLMLILSTLFLLTSCGDVPTTASKFKVVNPLEETYSVSINNQTVSGSYYKELLDFNDINRDGIELNDSKFFYLDAPNINGVNFTVAGAIIKTKHGYLAPIWAFIKNEYGIGSKYSLNANAKFLSEYGFINGTRFDLNKQEKLMREYLESYAKEHNIKLN